MVRLVSGDRAVEAMTELAEKGSAFICTGYIGGGDPASGWSWELWLYAFGPATAGVKFLSRDGKTAHIALANVDQLNRLGHAVASAVGLMRRWDAEVGR